MGLSILTGCSESDDLVIPTESVTDDGLGDYVEPSREGMLFDDLIAGVADESKETQVASADSSGTFYEIDGSMLGGEVEAAMLAPLSNDGGEK